MTIKNEGLRAYPKFSLCGLAWRLLHTVSGRSLSRLRSAGQTPLQAFEMRRRTRRD